MNPLLTDVLDVDNLAAMIEGRLIAVKHHVDGKLHILDYMPAAQFSRTWNRETRTCRGLIVDGDPLASGARIVSRPFAKFFNASEHGPDSPLGELPTGLPFEVFEKLDGSLGVFYENRGGRHVATRGSFISDQAQWATKIRQEKYPNYTPPEGTTLLVEIIAPWNRIVVNYGGLEDLVALALIDNATGADLPIPDDWPGERVRRFDGLRSYEDVLAMVAANGDDQNAEGYVVRFQAPPGAQSVRAKLKLAEYMRLHRLVTGVNSLVIWEHLSSHRELDKLLDRVPDEFYSYVEDTVSKLTAERSAIEDECRTVLGEVDGLSKKEAAGIVLAQLDKRRAAVVFSMIDNFDYDPILWKMVKPEYERPFWTLND